jgi:hypothetical protein
MELREMVELNDAELDAVSAGLVFVGVGPIVATDVIDVTVENILNNNNVNANVAVGVLSGIAQGIRPGGQR